MPYKKFIVFGKPSIKFLMNLMRIRDNRNFPPFFFYKGKKVNIKISRND